MKMKKLFIVIAIVVIAIVALRYLNSNYIEIVYIGSSVGETTVGWAPKNIILSINRLGNYKYSDNNNNSLKEDYAIESGKIEKDKLKEIEELILNITSSSTKIDAGVSTSEGYFLEYKNKEYEITEEAFNSIINAVNENLM